MTRCVPLSRPPQSRRALLQFVAAGLLGSILGAAPAQELVQRRFPADALRGTLRFTDPPDVLLNGDAARLAPGARIRGTNNLLAMSGALTDGTTYKVHYTVDFLGQIKDVWLLRDDELASFWPRSAEEAAQYDFDPAAQTWSKKS